MADFAFRFGVCQEKYLRIFSTFNCTFLWIGNVHKLRNTQNRKGGFRYFVNQKVGGSGHEKIACDYIVAGWVFEMIT